MKKLIKWVAGIIFLLAALGALGGGNYISFIFFLIAGLFCLPPSMDWLENKFFSNGLKSSFKYIIVIASWLIGSALVDSSGFQGMSRIDPAEWETLDYKGKKDVLNELINNQYKPYSTHRFEVIQKVLNLCQKSLKYGDTFEYQNHYGNDWYNDKVHFFLANENVRINDVENGVFTVTINFRGESAIGLKVRQKGIIKFKYDGKKSTIIDFDFS